jgi:hypothetical protein
MGFSKGMAHKLSVGLPWTPLYVTFLSADGTLSCMLTVCGASESTALQQISMQVHCRDTDVQHHMSSGLPADHHHGLESIVRSLLGLLRRSSYPPIEIPVRDGKDHDELVKLGILQMSRILRRSRGKRHSHSMRDGYQPQQAQLPG